MCLTSAGVEEDVRVAAGTRDSLIMIFDIDANGQMVAKFSVSISDTIPASIAFATNAEELYIFGLMDGNIHTLRDGEIVHSRHVGPCM